VFGSEEIEGVPVISMELVTGGTLRDRLKTEKFLPISDAAEAALQIINGLESANTAEVLHRDIKPANCFVSPDGSVKVGDFGLSVSTLARGESLLTAKGSVLGTPAYASPEQLRGRGIGCAFGYLLGGRNALPLVDWRHAIPLAGFRKTHYGGARQDSGRSASSALRYSNGVVARGAALPCQR
jgi:serine/threonine protein kinase